jgi:hypothetical protein
VAEREGVKYDRKINDLYWLTCAYSHIDLYAIFENLANVFLGLRANRTHAAFLEMLKDTLMRSVAKIGKRVAVLSALPSTHA